MRIKIGEVIQTLRKEKSLTQEQLAKFIGVSTPAVSKWESGNSYPDIELLPVLADFFNVSVDKLLNYKVDLSEEEVMKVYKELEATLAKVEIDLLIEEPLEEFKEDLESVERLANMYMEKYPQSYLLKLKISSLYQMYSYKFGKDKFNSKIKETTNILEDIVRNTDDIQIKETALLILSNAYYMLDDYEKAELYLNMIHKAIGDTSVNLAMIYLSQNRLDEAETLLQNKLFSDVFNATLDCKGLINVCKNKYKELKKELDDGSYNKKTTEKEMEYIKNKSLGYANISLEIKKKFSENRGAFFGIYMDYIELSLNFLFFNMKEEAKEALYGLNEILEKYHLHESSDTSQMMFFDKVKSRNSYTFNVYTNLLIMFNDNSFNELREEPIFESIIKKVSELEKMLKDK
ncbi:MULTISPECIES: helix-turn-helix domain-containing protein [unclassified Clostridioides]|uniref:helix-turn-helix domain-containing protein n=1 Tax=unclassified Clostridioides TaxID=2635829 RepID=UPI001D0F536F|nr:helix-turn-helix domain-containing protein [Clostridioides sp. ES-S-0001-02]MCC0640139.1 helix-turn-helix domain-containing protein [Clostridioides sp. ES-S-0049-03]MCC0655582.1 helix-turn-helix domain-containing protein [Clostridioides sp. ES-S-0123-01]MCC0673262.1 helix-turn-helix domain-containing protein [Clostridioides sp. ES-S-0145-01]MCC0674639.1 helix-turn-helix domain-containing protein [Clostridioides sp. ES-W-0018-02]MCC0679162.1 helix-turn-helix domain-containing protein [Clostr